MPAVEIRLNVADDGTLSVIDQAGNKIEALGQSADKSAGGFRGLTQGAMDLKAGFDIISGALSQSLGMIDSMNRLGVEAIRTTAAFDAFAGPNAARSIDAMKVSVKGLVDDTDLMKSATLALSSGAVTSTDQLGELARIGSTLGITFRGDAKAGIEDFTRALEMTGNARGLRTLGIDAEAVKKRFEELKSTMSDRDAWSMAVFEVAGKNADRLSGALDSTGTALDRLKVGISQAMEEIGVRVAKGIEGLLQIPYVLDLIAEKSKARDSGVVFKPENAAAAVIQEMEAAQADQAAQQAMVLRQQQEAAFRAQQEKTVDLRELFGGSKMELPPQYQGFVSGTMTDNAQAQQAMAWMRQGERGLRADQGAEDTAWMAQQGLRRESDMAREYEMWVKLAQIKAQDRALDAQAGTAMGFAKKDEATFRDQQAAMGLVGNLFADLRGKALDYSAAINRVTASVREASDAQKNYTSIAQAFGTTSGGIGGEIEGDLTGALSSREAQAAKRYGKGSREYAATLAEDKKALDDYALATGQATEPLLAFRDARESLRASFDKGDLTLAQFQSQVLGLVKAAQEGKTSLDDLFNAAHPGVIAQIDATIKRKGGGGYLDPEDDPRKRPMAGDGSGVGGVGDKPGKAPGDDIKGGYENATKAVNDTKAAIGGLPGAAASAATGVTLASTIMATMLSAVDRNASSAAGNVAAIGNAIRGLQGVLTIAVTMSTAGGGGGRLPDYQ